MWLCFGFPHRSFVVRICATIEGRAYALVVPIDFGLPCLLLCLTWVSRRSPIARRLPVVPAAVVVALAIPASHTQLIEINAGIRVPIDNQGCSYEPVKVCASPHAAINGVGLLTQVVDVLLFTLLSLFLEKGFVRSYESCQQQRGGRSKHGRGF